MVGLLMIEYMTFLGMIMVLLFLDSRYSRRRTYFSAFCITTTVMAAVLIMYRTFGSDTTLQIYSLIAHLPTFLFLLVFSRFRGWRLVFQLLSSVLFCMLIQHTAGLLYYLSNGQIWVLLLSYLILSSETIWFLICFLRPLFLQIMMTLQHGWKLICLIISVYYFIIIYLIPGYVGSSPSSTILKPAISLLMAGFYSILIFLFTTLRRESEARYSAELYALQLSALENRMNAVKASEEAMRTERHDLRHRFHAVTELIVKGDSASALLVLDAAQKRLDKQKEIRWCRPPVLDAVFSSYFDQAKHHQIQIKTTLSLSDRLPVDETELAVVLANALENAIHANLKLPPAQRRLRCKMLGTPSIMLEILNPCAEPPRFDCNGFPIAQKSGHGLGVQSISSFCQKHGAVCQFELTDGWFRFCMVV